MCGPDVSVPEDSLARSILRDGRGDSGEVEMLERPEGHGYVIAEVIGENPFFPVGSTLRGHEFHHSGLRGTEGLSFAYRVKRGQGISGKKDGVVIQEASGLLYASARAGFTPMGIGFVSLAFKVRDRGVRLLLRG